MIDRGQGKLSVPKVLVPFLFLIVLLSACDSERPRLPAGVHLIAYDNAGGLPVAIVNGKPFTQETIRKYQQIYMPLHAHGDEGEEPFSLESLVDRELLLQWFLSNRYERKGKIGDSVEIDFLVYLGLDYFNNRLKNEISYPADEVTKRLPKRFLMGNFDLMPVESAESGKALAKTIKGKKDFDRIASERKAKVAGTGPIFPDSGFFTKFDDMGAFNSKPGEFLGYMETGVGGALVLTREIGPAPNEKILEIVNRVRAETDEAHLGEVLAKIREKANIRYDKKGVAAMAAALLARRPPEDDFDLGTFAGYRLSARQFLWKDLVKPLNILVRERDLEKISEGIRNQVYDLGSRAALGIEALRNGYGEIKDPRNAFSFNEVKRNFYYQMFLEDLDREVRPTGAEVETLYREKPELFTEKERAFAFHIFTKERKKIERIRKEILGGKPFQEAAKKESEDEMTAKDGGSLGWMIRDPQINPAILSAVFDRPVGEVSPVIEGEHGFHLVMATDRKPRRLVPLAEMREKTIERMTLERREKKRAEILEREKSVAKIELFPERIPLRKKTIDVGPGPQGAKPQMPPHHSARPGTRGGMGMPMPGHGGIGGPH